MITLYCFTLGHVLSDWKVRSESCKHLHVVEITQSDRGVKFTVVFEMPEQHVSFQRICR